MVKDKKFRLNDMSPLERTIHAHRFKTGVCIAQDWTEKPNDDGDPVRTYNCMLEQVSCKYRLSQVIHIRPSLLKLYCTDSKDKHKPKPQRTTYNLCDYKKQEV